MASIINSSLLVPPANEAVALADAKAWLRIDTNDEDSLVAALIPPARAVVEAATRRLLLTQTWRLSVDAWPPDGMTARPSGNGAAAVPLPLAPVASISALRVYDAAGVAQVIDPASYGLFDKPDQARIVFFVSPPAPGRALSGIEIDVVAGYGAAIDVPPALRQAMLVLIARWYENRGDTPEAGLSELPPAAVALIAPFRRPRLI